MLVRRIILLILHTYCPEAVMRQTLMLTMSMCAMLLHLTAWPCKDKRANIAGIVSNVALVTVCLINLMRAMFEVAKFIPRGEVLYLLSATKLRRLCFYTCLSVILFTGGGGYLGRYTPRDQVHPPGSGSPWQVHPPGPGTTPQDQVHTPRDQVHPPSRYTPQDQVHPLQQTATVADGTHPTGMHSCL